MSKNLRIVLFVGVLTLLGIIYFLNKTSIDDLGDRGVILLASLVMISFVVLLVEHYFTKPTDVIASTVSILLLLAPLHDRLSAFGLWYEIFILYNSILLISALVSLLLFDPNKALKSKYNLVSNHLKNFSSYFGNGKVLWFSFFILTLLFYVDSQSSLFLWLFGYCVVLLLIDPKKYILSFSKRVFNSDLDIGEIFGVQSTNTFLAKLYQEKRKNKAI